MNSPIYEFTDSRINELTNSPFKKLSLRYE